MPEFNGHQPGTFCWVALSTTDRAAAKKFYGGLFGWSYDDVPAGPNDTYTLAQISGKDVGGMSDLMDEQKTMNIPPHWASYIEVADCDATVAKAAQLGGQVLVPTIDVMGKGKMAFLADPDGAAFGLWQSMSHKGAQLRDEPNTLCWNELGSRRLDVVGAFYTNLFGWKTNVMTGAKGPYTMFLNGETPIGGMYPITPDMGAMPSHWIPYFAVADLEASNAKVKSLGGKTIMGPVEVPNMGRFTIQLDPQGAAFALWRPL